MDRARRPLARGPCARPGWLVRPHVISGAPVYVESARRFVFPPGGWAEPVATYWSAPEGYFIGPGRRWPGALLHGQALIMGVTTVGSGLEFTVWAVSRAGTLAGHGRRYWRGSSRLGGCEH